MLNYTRSQPCTTILQCLFSTWFRLIWDPSSKPFREERNPCPHCSFCSGSSITYLEVGCSHQLGGGFCPGGWAMTCMPVALMITILKPFHQIHSYFLDMSIWMFPKFWICSHWIASFPFYTWSSLVVSAHLNFKVHPSTELVWKAN